MQGCNVVFSVDVFSLVDYLPQKHKVDSSTRSGSIGSKKSSNRSAVYPSRKFRGCCSFLLKVSDLGLRSITRFRRWARLKPQFLAKLSRRVRTCYPIRRLGSESRAGLAVWSGRTGPITNDGGPSIRILHEIQNLRENLGYIWLLVSKTGICGKTYSDRAEIGIPIRQVPV